MDDERAPPVLTPDFGTAQLTWTNSGSKTMPHAATMLSDEGSQPPRRVPGLTRCQRKWRERNTKGGKPAYVLVPPNGLI